MLWWGKVNKALFSKIGNNEYPVKHLTGVVAGECSKPLKDPQKDKNTSTADVLPAAIEENRLITGNDVSFLHNYSFNPFSLLAGLKLHNVWVKDILHHVIQHRWSSTGYNFRPYPTAEQEVWKEKNHRKTIWNILAHNCIFFHWVANGKRLRLVRKQITMAPPRQCFPTSVVRLNQTAASH